MAGQATATTASPEAAISPLCPAASGASCLTASSASTRPTTAFGSSVAPTSVAPPTPRPSTVYKTATRSPRCRNSASPSAASRRRTSSASQSRLTSRAPSRARTRSSSTSRSTRRSRSSPAPPADRPLLKQLKAIGVGPGLNPTAAGLSAATLQGMRAAVTNGPRHRRQQVVAMYLRTFTKYNGYLTGSFGQYGTNYALTCRGRPDRPRRPHGRHRHLPARADGSHAGAAHRDDTLRAAHPQEPLADSRTRVLVADDV